MSSEPKPLASLSSSLLARKGQAKPAMRPQGFAGFGFAQTPSHDDLGWNDMGHDPAPVPAAVPTSAEIVPIHADVQTEPEPTVVVHQQQKAIARELASPASLTPARTKMVRAAPGSKGKAAFTLRLDPERHLKLRLVCAVEHRSAQHIVIDALDAFLAEQASVGQLAATIPTKKSR